MTSCAHPMGHCRDDSTPYTPASRKTSHKSSTLSKALEKAQIAVQRDRAGNVRGALSSYRSARELLGKAKRRTTSEEDAQKIESISRAYEARIQELREAINSEPREEGDESFSEDGTSSTPYSSIDVPRSMRRPTMPASRPNTPQTPRSPHPSRRDSHQQWPLTPEVEIKATMERYMKRKLPERPPSRMPRFSRQFDAFDADDETIEILEQCESGWWNDLLEGNVRWSLSSDRTLVASPRAPLKESSKFRYSFSPQRNGAESPTDSIRFRSPPATPIRTGFGAHDMSYGQRLSGLAR
ncbi:Putative MIT domain-containing protein [Septoria linicola]|uniref:MIT domain-containing protein n=1 Tax=Septoria linicola TaxID=215465 RepID=A0A9Q9EFF4_9PEZI|nr:putative MIT domain-containing protein [Septoria linicola]USW48900.1 Putative MIT domain-containing protein [Septoria linicola]